MELTKCSVILNDGNVFDNDFLAHQLSVPEQFSKSFFKHSISENLDKVESGI